MKNILLILSLVFSSSLSPAQNNVDVIFNPLGFILLIDGDDWIHLDISVEKQISEDFGIMLSFVTSPLPLNNNFDIPFSSPNSAIQKMFIFQTNYYLRPKRKLDRWYITGMLGTESAKGDFSRFNFSSSSFSRNIANGKIFRLHIGYGLGYKRIFRKVVLNLGTIITTEIANHYTQSLLDTFPNLKKESIYSRGLRFTFGIGYRFSWDKSLFENPNRKLVFL